jgi:type IV pilus assembly protein PilC
MGRFSFKIGTPTGSIRLQEAEGETREAVRRSLEAKGYFVFEEGGEARPRVPLRLPSFGVDRIRPQTMLVFNQELLALVKAGLPIIQTLDLLTERASQPRLRSMLEAIREAVKGGAALSAAMAKFPRVFPPLYTASLQAGEQSGNFVDALTRYVEYQKRFLLLRQRFRTSLIYPAVLCLASASLVVFLLTFVVPTFTRIYSDMDQQLPAATRVLVTVTQELRRALPLVAVGLAILGGLLWRWRMGPVGRRVMDGWVLRAPLVGEIVRGYLLSRFARTLAMMLGGGIPMIPSLETTIGALGNAHLTERIREAVPRVAAGMSLADALGASGVVPSLLLELVAVGERSGSLGEMLGHVADLYDADMETRLTSLAAVIEPAIMIGMGLVVATIVIVMYLPIFHLASVVH